MQSAPNIFGVSRFLHGAWSRFQDALRIAAHQSFTEA